MAMEALGPKGLFIYSAVASLGLAAFILVRIVRVQRPRARGGFADIAPTSSASAALTPRAEISAAGSIPASDTQPRENARDEASGTADQKDASAVARIETSS